MDTRWDIKESCDSHLLLVEIFKSHSALLGYHGLETPTLHTTGGKTPILYPR